MMLLELDDDELGPYVSPLHQQTETKPPAVFSPMTQHLSVLKENVQL
jgi:hypothetical protein